MTATRSRRTDIASAIAALATLLFLLVGVPLVLAALAGWPLPRALPNPSQIRDALDNGWAPSGTFVLKTVALVAWLAWFQIAASVIAELVSAFRGRPGGRPVWLGGWAQPIAGRLVATAMLLHTLTASAAQPSALPALATASVAMAPPAATDTRPVLIAVTEPVRDEPALPIYQIQRHDTLWDIAQRHLGDPLRWREIFELNRDRVQPDGRRLGDPDRIYPGWSLVLPADAANLDPVAQTATVTRAPTTPPPTAAPAPPPSAPPVAVEAPGRAGVVTSPPASEDGGEHRSERHRVPVRDVGLPLLAASGLVVALDQARRRRQRQRRPGQVPPRPPAATEAMERKARASAAEEPAEWADAALRYLAAQLAHGADPAPTIIGIRPGELGVEILLAAPATQTPNGFTAADGGLVWRLDDGLDLETLQPTSDGMSAPCPALVTLGDTADGPMLINLEHLGVLVLDGDPKRCAAFLDGLVLEAATAPWAALNRVIYAGPNDDELNKVENVEHTNDLQKTAEEVQGFATATENDLGSRRASTFAARVEAAWADAWEANVVAVPAEGANPEALTTLVHTAKPHRSGVAVVTTAELPGRGWRLTFDADGNGLLEEPSDGTESAGADRLSPVRIAVRSTVDSEAVADAAALLANAAEPLVEDQQPTSEQVEAREPNEIVEPEVAVQVLGSIELIGLAQPTNRKKVNEAIVYLALHSDRAVPSDTLRCALWPLDDDGNDVAYTTFKQAMSRARSTLGTDSAGERHLPDAYDGAYRLGPNVGSDWDHFQALTRQARSLPSSEAAESLRAAMKLVRGAPFAGVAPGSYAWAWSEQIVTDIEVAITDAALQLAELSLDAGDSETADWAARQGLKVVPGHDGLQQVRMRAAHLIGNADAVDRAYRDARRAADAIDPLDGVSDETVTLFRKLKGEIGNGTPRNGNSPAANPVEADGSE